jgi:nitroreductase
MLEFAVRPLSALDAIFTRRSVRSFTPQPLEPATIQSLLDAAVQAPTAMHLEPWRFVVIQDRALLTRLSDTAKGDLSEHAAHLRGLHAGHHDDSEAALPERFASPDFNIFYDAATLVVICAKSLGPFVTADCWLAAQNLMLAACALGLGTCCIGSAVPTLNLASVKQELGIPDDVTAVVPIIVGVPADEDPRSDRREPQVLSWR